MTMLLQQHAIYITKGIAGIALAFCAGLLTPATAQTGKTGYFVQAEKLFKEKKYYEAAQYYEKYLETETQKGKTARSTPFAVSKKTAGKSNFSIYNETVYRLAESYRQLKDYTKAEQYYARAAAFSPKAYPDALYWYGVSLRANQKYDEALQALEQFREQYKTMDGLLAGADREIANLAFIKEQQQRLKDEFTITRQPLEAHGAYAATTPVNHEEVYFTAVHTDLKAQQDNKPYIVTRLFKSSWNDSKIAPAAERIVIPEETGFHTGMASFTRNGQKMFFTRWTVEDGQPVSAIYRSEKTDTGWSKPLKMPAPLNMKGSNSAQPFVTGEDHFLLFSSDRPGGIGKYDLWFARLDTDGNVLQVTHMGEKVNTTEDELAPSYHTRSRQLFYSSNGRTGMGGFDIYYTRGDFQMLNWETPENPGAPINSSRDDLYYVSTDDVNVWNSGFLSSDRDTDCCLDLYAIQQNNKQYVTGRVIDCDKGQPVAGAQVTVKDARRGKLLLNRQTGADGVYTFELRNTSVFDIVADKPGFETEVANFTLKFSTREENFTNRDICMTPIQVTPSIPEVDDMLSTLTEASTLAKFSFNKFSLNQSYYRMLDSLVTIMQRYPDIFIEIGGHTDSKGSEEYNLKLAESRVRACIQYLASKGIERKRLIGKAYGECCPVAPEFINGVDNPEGRERNRRVEYKLVQGNTQ